MGFPYRVARDRDRRGDAGRGRGRRRALVPGPPHGVAPAGALAGGRGSPGRGGRRPARLRRPVRRRDRRAAWPPAGPGWASRSPTPTAATRPRSPRPRPRSRELAPGRFVLGLGSGEGLNTAPLGIERTRPVRRLGEALEIITRLLGTDGPVSFAGEHFTLDRLPGMADARPRRAAGRDRARRALGRAARPRRPLRHRLAPGAADRRPTQYAERLAVARDAAAERRPRPGSDRARPLPLRGDPRGPRRRGEGARRAAAPRAGARRQLGAVRRRPGSSTRSARASPACATTSPSGCPPRPCATRPTTCPRRGRAALRRARHARPRSSTSSQPFVDVGVRRIVLDNLLPLGIPEELEGANRATRAAIRAARLTFRSAVVTTLLEQLQRDLFWKVRADPRRADVALASRAHAFPYFVPVGSPLGREVVVDGEPQAHVRLEQLPRPGRRPAGRRGRAAARSTGSAPAAPAPGS